MTKARTARADNYPSCCLEFPQSTKVWLPSVVAVLSSVFIFRLFHSTMLLRRLIVNTFSAVLRTCYDLGDIPWFKLTLLELSLPSRVRRLYDVQKGVSFLRPELVEQISCGVLHTCAGFIEPSNDMNK